MNLRSINLNLLKTLQVLLKTRNVTVASRELFISQPAVSASLKQLRVLFNDKLLIKGEGGLLTLTHKAGMIKPQLEQWLKQGENIIGLNEKIIPEKLAHTFQVALHSQVSEFIFPKLYRYLKKHAPLVTVKETSITDLNDLSYKELYHFDLIIGVFKNIPKDYLTDFYYSDHLICLSGNKLLNKKDKITKKDLNTFEHVIGTYLHDYTHSISEPFLKAHGIQRQHRMIVTDIVLAARLAYLESLLVVISKRQAAFLQTIYPLKLFELPWKSPALTTEILYKEIEKDNPLIIWFKEVLHKCLE
ncbi:MAG: hypothetical protein A3F11_10245 [Gammaproteobacteria bacterium RIFCSPHIGHO2_12_FULL_37_14]|nr:MAG: hypothetical protein A3F11_10245 [Gammaproteobacteria bacterium RIFCSPHIGHO2_12_FULL_37_14]